jgi:WD40 repeat protein
VNDCDKEYGRSITDVGGIFLEDGSGVIAVSCSSGGADYHEFGDHPSSSKFSLIQTPTNVVRFQTLQSKATLLLIGTSAPRYNKIHIYRSESHERPSYCGSLPGHEDWISCFDWAHTAALDYLASGSHDARIRLWKFEAKNTKLAARERKTTELDGSLSDEGFRAEEEDGLEEGESRLEIFHDARVTSVYLEALLIGHEEPVTSVSWHPCPKSIYGRDLILISSSMDRTILVWGEHESGILTPISRVGSAGGILDGPVGSSLSLQMVVGCLGMERSAPRFLSGFKPG